VQYKTYTLNNFKSLPQIKALSDEQLKSIEIVGSVLPFKTNNYITDYLINWSNVPDDPMFVATFPQKEMLLPEDYATIESLYDAGADEITIQQAANEIRLRLNPHPAGQLEYNTPVMDDEKLTGLQHKYRQTVLFFPNQGQKCHAYCTFCFRWPQFTGLQELKMASPQSDNLIKYLAAHPEVSDVLITGGDPMVMSAKVLSSYIDPLLGSDLPNLRTIRIGTRALSFWPFRFLTDSDCEELLALFKKITDSGLHLAFMANSTTR
jgi:L-lysine 2,3-aminomutase